MGVKCVYYTGKLFGKWKKSVDIVISPPIISM